MPDVMKPIDNESDSPSSRGGPIQPTVGRATACGVTPDHPELSASHPDAQLARIADCVVSGEEAALGHGADRLTRPPTAALAPSSQLVLREKHK